MFLCAFLAAIFIGAEVGLAADSTALIHDPAAETIPIDPAPFPILEKIFKKALTEEQLSAIGPQTNIDRISAVLSPAQKADVHKGLDDAREKAATPAELKEIAEGYLLLGATSDDSKVIAAIGMKLSSSQPRRPDGYSLVAESLYQQKNYPAAAAMARRAWEVSMRKDKRAWALFKMSEGRVAGGAGSASAQRDSHATDSTHQDRGMPEHNEEPPSSAVQNIYPTAKANRAIHLRTIPEAPLISSVPSQTPKPGLPLYPITAVIGLTAVGYGVYRSRRTWSNDDGLDPAPEISPSQIRKNYLRTAAVAGGALIVLAAWEFGPGTLSAARTVFSGIDAAVPISEPALAGVNGITLGGNGLVAGQSLITAGAGAVGVTAAAVGGRTLMRDQVAISQSDLPIAHEIKSGPHSDIKKPSAQDPELQNLIDDLFQPQDRLPGGTAGAVRKERFTGRPTMDTFHKQKAEQYVNAINNLLKRRAIGQSPLSPLDRATAEAIRADLQNALNIATVKSP